MLVVLIDLIITVMSAKVQIEGWTFSETGTDKWYKANVPSTVHLDLLDNGLIEDPYINDNIDKMQSLENKVWTYTTKFSAHKGFDQTRLIFEGLDTHVEILLNGQNILDTDNQHRVWIVNLLNFFEKDNILTLNFNSASAHDIRAAQRETVPIPYSYAYSRKSSYHYGWDWGPRIITCGIWKPVYLEQTNFGAIRHVHLRTQSMVEQIAKVQISVKTQLYRQTTDLLFILFIFNQIISEIQKQWFHSQSSFAYIQYFYSLNFIKLKRYVTILILRYL